MTRIDAPGAGSSYPSGTFPYAINSSGQIAGQVTNGSSVSHGYLFSGGSFTTIDPPGATYAAVNTLNDSGQMAGSFYDSNQVVHVFLFSGGTFTTIDPPGAAATYAGVTGMNSSGQIVGYFGDSVFKEHGFLFSGGIFTTIDVPGDVYTQPIAINDSGKIVGQFQDSANRVHGFLFSGDSFTTIDPPRDSYAFANAINNLGQIVGQFQDGPNVAHGFLFSGGSFTTIDPPSAYATTRAFATAINDSGQIAGTFYSDATSRFYAFLASKLVTLLDPVPDLLDGPAVTTAVNVLSVPSLEHPVNGVSADGITQVVVQISATTAGEQYTLTLMNDSNSQSSSPDQDGALGNPGASTFSQSQVVVTASDTVNGPMGFAIYRAPVDFARPLKTSDAGASQRSVSIQVLDGGTGATTTAQVQIIRTPVALIHGLWSNPSTWNEFAESLNSNNLFGIYRVDYQSTNFAQVKTNEIASLDQLAKFLGIFKKTRGVAAVQFDLVGHSMGGLISRYMVHDSRFYMDGNYRQGWIHKLITIDTPHAGSIVPALLDKSGAVCHEIFNGADMLIDGATHDLEPGSDLLETLYSLPLPPTHAIAGSMTPTQDAAASLAVNEALLVTTGEPVLACSTLFLDVVPFSFNGLYGGPNDIAVAESSQIYGFPQGLAVDLVPGVVHSGPSFPWLLQWAGVPPGALSAASGNAALVLNLLNTPPSSGAFKQGIQ